MLPLRITWRNVQTQKILTMIISMSSSCPRWKKERIQASWLSALIIKMFRKSIGFKFIDYKIRSIWKPQGDLQVIDLRSNFFLVCFKLGKDYWKVVDGGLWFINQQFFDYPSLNPGFCPFEAKISTIVIWARLPKLPIELYDSNMLCHIGK